MSKISIYMLLTGLVTGIAGIAFFLYGMNPEQKEIPVASISESTNSDKNISSEGITMRGDWELTVSDPDGSNPYVYNFQNKIESGAFDVISRGLLPTDHELKGALRAYNIRISDKYQTESNTYTQWNICNMGANYEDVVGSILIVEPTLEEPTDSLYSGLTLTGSCLVEEPNANDSDTPIEIDRVDVRAIYGSPPDADYWSASELFASKTWDWSTDDPITVNSPGQMISMTVNFTFE